jgi:hypothetical protein
VNGFGGERARESLIAAGILKEGRDKYCSRTCADAFRRKGIDRHCTYCAKKFYASAGEMRRRGAKYCSVECSTKSHRCWKTFTCRFCGVKFRRRGAHKFMYCSRNCMNADVGNQRRVGKRKDPRLIYSPELLRLMSQSNGDTCSFPECSDSRGRARNPWNACSRHGQKIQRALHEANKRRLHVLAEHGLQPV